MTSSQSFETCLRLVLRSVSSRDLHPAWFPARILPRVPPLAVDGTRSVPTTLEPLMGKKKSVRKVRAADRVARKQPYSGQRLGVVIERVRDQATRLATLARTIDEAKLDNVVIDGHAMLVRGLNQIDNFIDNASRAVREAKVKREF